MMLGKLPYEEPIRTQEEFQAWLRRVQPPMVETKPFDPTIPTIPTSVGAAIANVLDPMVQAGVVSPEELNVAVSALQKIQAGDPGLSTSEREIVERMHAAKVPAAVSVEEPVKEKSPLLWLIPAGLALRFLL